MLDSAGYGVKGVNYDHFLSIGKKNLPWEKSLRDALRG